MSDPDEMEWGRPSREAPPDATPEFYGPAKLALWLGLAAWACLAANAAVGGSAPLLLLGIAVAIAGVVVGIVAVLAIGRSRGRLTGKGSAIAGICISGAHIVAMVVLAVLMLSVIDKAERLRCAHNLEQIGHATQMWLNLFGRAEEDPPSLEKLLAEGYIDYERVFICPGTDSVPVRGKLVTDYEALFDRTDFKIKTSMIPPGLPMAWDEPGNHSDGSNVVYFGNNEAEFVSEERFRELMKQVDAWIEKNRPKEK